MPYLKLDPAAAVAAPILTDGAPLTDFGHTLAQLRGELLVALGNRGDVTDPQLNTWINDAYLLLASGLKIKETKSSFSFLTTNGAYLYRLPPQVRYTIGASLIDQTDFPFDGGVQLAKIDEQTFRRLPDLVDVPSSYFVYGNLMGIWAAPTGQTIVVETAVRPLVMVLDPDSPILPLEWHRGLLIKAKAFAYSDLEEWDSADRAQNEYVRFVREIGDPEAEEKTSQIASFRRINRRGQIRRYGSLPNQREDW